MRTGGSKWKRIVIAGAILSLSALAFGMSQFFKPHRDVESAEVDFILTAEALSAEFLADESAANTKYLSADGRSSVVEVEGIISQVSKDYQGALQLHLEAAPASVQVQMNAEPSTLPKVGDVIKVKAVVRAGCAYDEDLNMYTPVILTEGYLSK